MLFPCLRARCCGIVLSAALVAASAMAAAARPPAAAPGAAAAPAATAATARFIVKLRAGTGSSGRQAAAEELRALAARHDLELAEVRHIVAGIHLLRVQQPRGATPEQLLARLRADPQVQYAESDHWRQRQATPDDPLFGEQWYEQSAEPAAVDAMSAWDVSSGSPGLVIADLDTGVRFDHPDLRNASANRLLPGYNMISSPAIANNSYGRGPDASDPGDWVTEADLSNPVFADANCTVSNSSWHGTRVAGILGAISDNDSGIAGMTWEGWIEPVRVLGRCGGYDSDIIAGMAWAAGNHVDGVPDNPYPARILNMSLGAVGSCSAAYQQMVDQLLAENVLVVVSAGNQGGPVDAPADCAGVAAVAGLREDGTKVGYSSLGPQIAISAPAGNCVNTLAGQPCLYSIVTTTNSGTTVPATNTYTDAYNYNVGTSFAAPQVAAIAALMLAVNANLTPGQLIARLQAAAQPFPVSSAADMPTCHVPTSSTDLQTSECNCTTSTCGAGMVNASGALQQALRPIAAVSVPPVFTPGSIVPLDASGSGAACNASIVSYQWTVETPTTDAPLISNAGSAHASIAAPGAGATYVLTLTVTDSAGRSDSTPITLKFNSSSTPAPASAGDAACLTAVSYTVGAPTSDPDSAAAGGDSGGGGGGGALDLLTLLAAAGLRPGARRYSSRCAASSQGRCARR